MITILGGGVAGASLAWALARRGRRDVTVFDILPPGSGSTGRAAGGFRTQFLAPLNVRLSLASRPFFEARAEQIGFRSVGYLYVAEDAATAAELRRRAEAQRALGLPVEHPDPHDLVPGLGVAHPAGASYCALDGVYEPPRVLAAFVEEATAAGATFRYVAAASPADLAAEVVVVAAGMWSRKVGMELGVDLPVLPLERGVFQVGPFDWLPGRLPMTIDAATGYHVRARDGRLLVMFPGDPRNWNGVRAWLARWLPRAAVEQPEGHWTGYYEMTADHHPLVGPTSRPGVWASCGFSGHGVMHAPAIAESLAAMILGETPPLDISALDPRRTTPLEDATTRL